MGIYNYIKDILLFNGVVVVPGLGSFRLKEEPSKIIGNRITPPKSRMIFESDQETDDDILKLKLSEGEEISRESASQAIQDYVDEINLALDQGQNFEIKTLGILYRDPEEHYHFDPDPDMNLDFDAFGLETFELEDIEDGELEDIEKYAVELKDEERVTVFPGQEHEKTNDQESSDISEEEVVMDENPSVERYILQDIEEEPDKITVKSEGEPIKETVSDDHEEFAWHVDPTTLTTSNSSTTISDDIENTMNNRRKNRNILWILIGTAVVILLAFILLPLKTNLFNHGLNLGFLNKADSFMIDDNFAELNDEDMDFDALVDKVEKDIDSVTETGSGSDYSTAEEVNEKSTGKYAEYHIIAGSFKSNKNASQLQQSLTMDGYPSLVIERGDGLYRVSAIGFNDKEKALNELQKFRGRKGMKSAWVLGLN